MLGAVVLLVLVLVPGIGREVNGSTRWIGIGGLNMQPSELAKLCFVIYLAADVRAPGGKDPARAVRGCSSRSRCSPWSPYCCTANRITARLFVLSATVFAMLFLAGVPMAQYAVLAGAAAVALVAAALLGKGYVIQRLTSFIDPFADPYGSGFQLTQSLIAIGRGSWLGVGLGEGRPEAVLPAGGAYRFPLRRARGGIRPHRYVDHRRALHVHRAAFAFDRAGTPRPRGRGSRRMPPTASACCSACMHSSTSESTSGCCRPRGSPCR